MIQSLLKHASAPIRLCVLWLDDKPLRRALQTEEPHDMDAVTLNQFMNSDARLFDARKNRSWRSFCWTLEPALVHSCLKAQPDGDIIVYCDSDVMWFADPIPAILSVMENADVALSRHHFPVGQEGRERTVGVYNFGCGVFRACDLTRRIVDEWLDQTLERCDEYGAGDQKYLDEWPHKFGDRLTELPEGWNIGPWRNAHAWIGTGESSVAGQLYIFTRKPTTNPYSLAHGFKWQDDIVPVTSWHMHEFRRGIGHNPVKLKGEDWNRSGYSLDSDTIQNIYIPYERELEKFL